jgi:hypothetical protein
MEHKAYAFDWRAFEFDLLPLLVDSLLAKETGGLVAYIDQHRNELTDPDEGQPLPVDWRNTLGNRDVHEFGDYALTRFYDPDDCWGVGYTWAHLSDELPEPAANVLLGFTVGPAAHRFDPGRYGSYFQTPELVHESLAVLEAHAWI